MNSVERRAYWDKFFEKDVDAETVHDLVADFIDHRKYEDVIDCIEMAILHGQIQPWMHQVLALSMQAAGRPKAQIERVLLSSQDLIANDPMSMMSLAAYLVRFDRNEQAIELYRQAAALNPARPEPFILALEIAARTQNHRAIVWSAPEVLSYSWSKGREHLNRLAEQSAAEAIAAFVKEGDFASATELQNSMQKARQLDLVVRLEWNGQGDLDLQVAEPDGAVCSVINPMTAGGGVFVHDGYGPKQEHCYEEYLCPQGFSGEYKVIVKHVSGDIIGKRARVLIIRDRGKKREETITETIFLGPKDQSVRFSLANGRRVKPHVDPQATDQKSARKPSDQAQILAQLGNGGGGGGGFGFGQRSAAVGYTPVVSLINEGIRMSAMATVSGDRRYVRINAVPIFSTITDVFTFTAVR